MKTSKEPSNKKDELDKLLEADLRGLPYQPPTQLDSGANIGERSENPVIFLEFAAMGGRTLKNGKISAPSILGKLHFELRRDLLPVTCSNFVTLCTGITGYGHDGVNYHYKGTKIHRIVRDQFFQGGDLLGLDGLCSR
jgi:hypothetical protein